MLMGAEGGALGVKWKKVVGLAEGVREGTVWLGVGELDWGAAGLGEGGERGGGRKRLGEVD